MPHDRTHLRHKTPSSCKEASTGRTDCAACGLCKRPWDPGRLNCRLPAGWTASRWKSTPELSCPDATQGGQLAARFESGRIAFSAPTAGIISREGPWPFAVAAVDVGVTEQVATGPEIMHRAGVPTSAPDERLLPVGKAKRLSWVALALAIVKICSSLEGANPGARP